MQTADEILLPLRLATVVVPVAMYFLILGLLNSRRHPQVLSGTMDLALLLGALSPLVLVPVAQAAGMTVAVALTAVAVIAALAAAARTRGGTWVIYNISQDQARQLVERAIQTVCRDFQTTARGWIIDGSAYVELSAFPLLRNVSVRVHGDADAARRIGREIARSLASVEAQASPMAVGLLVVATAMMVAPLTMVAHRVPELVRILTDLVH